MSELPPYRYIVVEGPLGVGKAALCERLAERLEAHIVHDETENPFLRDFYSGRPGAAFQAQLFFLLNRYKQQQELKQGDLFRRVTICDYLFVKDRIFAYLNLSDSELLVYEKLYGVLAEEVLQPDLVIYLQADNKVLMKRLQAQRRRDLPEVTAEYIQQVNQAYNYYFFHYSDSPLLVINTSEVDLAASPSDLDALLDQVRHLKAGTQYYVPLSGRRDRAGDLNL
ncbi:MAG TPA: deoxynucleoside kinase [Acidobacteriota bacterium]